MPLTEPPPLPDPLVFDDAAMLEIATVAASEIGEAADLADALARTAELIRVQFGARGLRVHGDVIGDPPARPGDLLARALQGRIALDDEGGFALPALALVALAVLLPGPKALWRRLHGVEAKVPLVFFEEDATSVVALTPDEGGPFESVARDNDLAVVYLVAPTTPPARRATVAARSGGFLYCVSLVGVTGARAELPASVAELVREVTAVSPVPVGVGFGVSRPEHVAAIASAGAAGVIVASALVDALGEGGTDVEAMERLVRELAGATAVDASPAK